MCVCLRVCAHTRRGTCQLAPGVYLIVLSVVSLSIFSRPLLQEGKRNFPDFMPAEQMVKHSQNPPGFSANAGLISV